MTHYQKNNVKNILGWFFFIVLFIPAAICITIQVLCDALENICEKIMNYFWGYHR